MKHRTALVTAASIVGVVLAGATAVGANLGILSSTDQPEELSSIDYSGYNEAAADYSTVEYITLVPQDEVVEVARGGGGGQAAPAQAAAAAPATPESSSYSMDLGLYGTYGGDVTVLIDGRSIKYSGLKEGFAKGYKATVIQEGERFVIELAGGLNLEVTASWAGDQIQVDVVEKSAVGGEDHDSNGSEDSRSKHEGAEDDD